MIHLPESSRKWVDYKMAQYEENPSLWLVEKEEITEYILTNNVKTELVKPVEKNEDEDEEEEEG